MICLYNLRVCHKIRLWQNGGFFMDSNNRQQITMRVSTASIAVNTLLSALKILAGIIAHSSAMISDGLHSASDVLSTFIVIIGVRFSEKKADANHPYGHERLECVAAILLATFLFLTGLGIGLAGIDHMAQAFHGALTIPVPGKLALIAAILSIIVKEAMYWYTRNAAQKIHSDALMADAWHHRFDALSSIGSFIGIAGARMGFPFLDPVASVVICVFIFKAAAEIFIDAVRKMMDESCEQETLAQMKKVILAQEGVHGLDVLKSRKFGSRIYMDVEISADGNITLYEAHEIAQHVHDELEKSFPEVKHCMVHVNPQ